MNTRELNDYLTILQEEIHTVNQARFPQTKQFIQHGRTSVYKHCIGVAYVSCLIAAKLHLNINIRSLIRGALLHDYFLYDWHVKDKSHRLHGFSHPRRAVVNAMQDFKLSPMERDIIITHMFPLTLQPPSYKEGWIVMMADKYCSLRETVAGWS